MQNIMSPDIPLSESMKTNIQTVTDKIHEVCGENIQPHFFINKKPGNRMSVKIVIREYGDEFFFEAKGDDFKALLDTVKSRAIRAITERKNKLSS